MGTVADFLLERLRDWAWNRSLPIRVTASTASLARLAAPTTHPLSSSPA